MNPWKNNNKIHGGGGGVLIAPVKTRIIPHLTSMKPPRPGVTALSDILGFLSNRSGSNSRKFLLYLILTQEFYHLIKNCTVYLSSRKKLKKFFCDKKNVRRRGGRKIL
jgi:hypothetical protein